MSIGENVRYVAKHKKMLIGDIEKQVGLSPGYFSREGTKISAEKLYEVSKILDVSMEDLITDRLREKIILEKIEELQKELKEVRGESK